MDEALMRHRVEPADFGERIRVVIGAQIEPGVILAAMQAQPRRLRPALVATGGLARLHRRHHPLRERAGRGEKRVALTWPAQSTQDAPVCTAMAPSASIRWIWRCPEPASRATRSAITASP